MQENKCESKCPDACVTLLLRLAIGLVFLTAGIAKFRMGVGAFAQGVMEMFKATALPGWMVAPYAYALPFLEVSLGFLLLVGLFTRYTFFFTAALTISLMWGMLLLGKGDVVAQNSIFVLLAILGLRWSNENMLSLDCLRKKDKTQ